MTDSLPTTKRDITHDATLFEIADRLALIKLKEEDFRGRRIALEARLIQEIDFYSVMDKAGKAEGSKTFTLADDLSDAKLRVTLTRKLSHKIEPSDLANIRDRIPVELLPVRVKEEPDMTALKKLRKSHPEVATLFSRALVSMPAKTGVAFPKP